MAWKSQGKQAVAASTAAPVKRTAIETAASSGPATTPVDDEDTSMEVDDHLDTGEQAPNRTATPPSSKSSETVDDENDDGLELLGQGMKALVTLVQDLRQLGVEDLVLPLPKIVVIGDQSTGKSSLIEGISGIKVPRSTGTTTRCPLEINLTSIGSGSPWKATMYLQKRYIYEGTQGLPFGKPTAARSERATKNRPFGPWIAQTLPENSLFFKTMKKTEIPEALRLAQLATLNPGSDPARYLPGANDRAGSYTQVKFSPNVIRLDISAPDVPNLSFYDLPGVINQAEVAEEEHLVTLVQNLVRSFIKDESCINLLAIPMTDDAANSTASKLVQEANAQARTIGVLTKPDRVQMGESMSQWHDVLDGSKFRIGHGYYVVKNNADPEVNNLVARQEEDQFFEREPWVRSLGAHKDRFGTLNLSYKLSKLLNAHIKTSLPQITEQVQLKTTQIIARLNELPEPPKGNLSLKILEKILMFENDLTRHLDGGSERYPFQKHFHAAALRFRSTIAFSYPRLSFADSITAFTASSQLPYRSSATPTPIGSRCSDIIPIDSDDEWKATTQKERSPSKRKQPPITPSQTSPTKRSRLDQIPQFVGQEDRVNNNSESSSMVVDRKAPFAKRFTLTGIRTILQDAHIGLPNQIHPEGIKRMVKESLSHWNEPLDELLAFTGQTCLAMVLERASYVFGLWQGTRCYDRLLEICQSFFQEKLRIQTLSAKRVLATECQTALTLNEKAMRAASEEALSALGNAYRNERVKAVLTKQDPEWETNVRDRSKLDKMMASVSDVQLGPNPFVQELRAMADVRGYYECAFSRFVDVVYQGIQTELFAACRYELGEALKGGIGLEEKDAEQRCAVLLAVDPENERLRAELIKQKSNLEKASEWLESQ